MTIPYAPMSRSIAGPKQLQQQQQRRDVPSRAIAVGSVSSPLKHGRSDDFMDNSHHLRSEHLASPATNLYTGHSFNGASSASSALVSSATVVVALNGFNGSSSHGNTSGIGMIVGSSPSLYDLNITNNVSSGLSPFGSTPSMSSKSPPGSPSMYGFDRDLDDSSDSDIDIEMDISDNNSNSLSKPLFERLGSVDSGSDLAFNTPQLKTLDEENASLVFPNVPQSTSTTATIFGFTPVAIHSNNLSNHSSNSHGDTNNSTDRESASPPPPNALFGTTPSLNGHGRSTVTNVTRRSRANTSASNNNSNNNASSLSSSSSLRSRRSQFNMDELLASPREKAKLSLQQRSLHRPHALLHSDADEPLSSPKRSKLDIYEHSLRGLGKVSSSTSLAVPIGTSYSSFTNSNHNHNVNNSSSNNEFSGARSFGADIHHRYFDDDIHDPPALPTTTVTNSTSTDYIASSVEPTQSSLGLFDIDLSATTAATGTGNGSVPMNPAARRAVRNRSNTSASAAARSPTPRTVPSTNRRESSTSRIELMATTTTNLSNQLFAPAVIASGTVPIRKRLAPMSDETPASPATPGLSAFANLTVNDSRRSSPDAPETEQNPPALSSQQIRHGRSQSVANSAASLQTVNAGRRLFVSPPVLPPSLPNGHMSVTATTAAATAALPQTTTIGSTVAPVKVETLGFNQQTSSNSTPATETAPKKTARRSTVASTDPAATATAAAAAAAATAPPVDPVEAPPSLGELLAAKPLKLTSPHQQEGLTVFQQYKAENKKWCRYCGITSTSNWRPGPWGKHTLCNRHGCDYRGYGFKNNQTRLDLRPFMNEPIELRVRPVVQLFCTVCLDPRSFEGNVLLYCSGCPHAYHQHCLPSGYLSDEDVAGLKERKENWYCKPECRHSSESATIAESSRRRMPLSYTPRQPNPTVLAMIERTIDGAVETVNQQQLVRQQQVLRLRQHIAAAQGVPVEAVPPLTSAQRQQLGPLQSVGSIINAHDSQPNMLSTTYSELQRWEQARLHL